MSKEDFWDRMVLLMPLHASMIVPFAVSAQHIPAFAFQSGFPILTHGFHLQAHTRTWMQIGKTLYVHTRRAWRLWLRTHHATEKEIWLIYYTKQSGKPRIPYNDAVEEALCYGWIDSIVKPIDGEKYAQRFSPRCIWICPMSESSFNVFTREEHLPAH